MPQVRATIFGANLGTRNRRYAARPPHGRHENAGHVKVVTNSPLARPMNGWRLNREAPLIIYEGRPLPRAHFTSRMCLESLTSQSLGLTGAIAKICRVSNIDQTWIR